MMNVLQEAAIAQQNFTNAMMYLGGYKTLTTFYGDFTIAEIISGVDGVKDTFNRAFEWKNDIKFFTELVLVLNHKAWEHHEKSNDELMQLYVGLYEEAYEYLWSNFEGDDAKYAFQVLD